MALRKYSVQEVRDAADAIGLDPDFAESIYGKESSYGNNPAALRARSVTLPKSRQKVIVRGPFQLTDGTFMQTARKYNLPMNAEDPDNHLEAALLHMKDVLTAADGDYAKAARIYKAGSDLPKSTDETGETTLQYGADIAANVAQLKAQRPALAGSDTMGLQDQGTPFVTEQASYPPELPAALVAGDAKPSAPLNIPGINPQALALAQRLRAGAPQRDSLGLPIFEMPHFDQLGGALPQEPANLPQILFADSPGYGLPAAFGAGNTLGDNLLSDSTDPGLQYANDADLTAYVNQLYDEEMQNRNYGGLPTA